MNRSTRIASAALTAALAVGISGPALASSDNAHEAAHSQQQSHTDAHKTKGKNAARQASRATTRLDARLARVAKDPRISRLSGEDKTALLNNIAADRAAIKALLADFTSQTTAGVTVQDTVEFSKSLRQFRPANYTQVINDFRVAAAISLKIDDLRAGVTDGSNEATALDAADAKITEAVTAARLIHANSPKSALRSVKASLHEAKVQAQAVEDSLGTNDSTNDSA